MYVEVRIHAKLLSEIFLAHSSTFRCYDLSRHCGRRHLVAKVGTSKGRGKQWQTTPKNLPRMQCARAIPVTWLGSGSCQARPSRPNTNEWMNEYIKLTSLDIQVPWNLTSVTMRKVRTLRSIRNFKCLTLGGSFNTRHPIVFRKLNNKGNAVDVTALSLLFNQKKDFVC